MNSPLNAVDLRGNFHTVRHCNINDVDTHFACVKHLVPEDDQADYKKMMQECSKSGTSFCIDNDCFLYTRQTRPKYLEAFALYGENEPLKVLAMFAYILLQVDKHLLFLNFNPHTVSTIACLKSLLTPTAIRRHHIANHDILVRCDKLRDKLSHLYDIRGITWEKHYQH